MSETIKLIRRLRDAADADDAASEEIDPAHYTPDDPNDIAAGLEFRARERRECADLIEQQAARIAALEAQISTVAPAVETIGVQEAWLAAGGNPIIGANKPLLLNMLKSLYASYHELKEAPAVDAQPVAIYQVTGDDANWSDTDWLTYESAGESARRIVYASAQSEGLRKDAWRYRHLRQCNSGSLVIVQIIGTGEDDQIVLTEEHADEAIDAALSQQQAQER